MTRETSVTAAVALGSNLDSEFGDREANLETAVARMGALGQVLAVSPVYETAPVGAVAQPQFLNGAVLLETDLSPEGLMHELLAIELGMGRDRSAAAVAKGPRVIDLDLLLYGDEVRVTPELTLPHPEMHLRAFVLLPLADIAPEWRHPVLGRTVREMLDEMTQTDGAVDPLG